MYYLETSKDGQIWKEEREYKSKGSYEKHGWGYAATAFAIAEHPFFLRVIHSEYKTANVIDFWSK